MSNFFTIGVLGTGLIAGLIPNAITTIKNNCEIVDTKIYAINGERKSILIERVSENKLVMVTPEETEKFEMVNHYDCFGFEFTKTTGQHRVRMH